MVLDANLESSCSGLVKLTWGNVSGIDRDNGLIAIKQSGIPYSDIKLEHIVVLDLAGKTVEGRCKPSVDTPTHLVLYNAFMDSVKMSIALEMVAEMAFGTMQINSEKQSIPGYIRDIHHGRKHGRGASYGQQTDH